MPSFGGEEIIMSEKLNNAKNLYIRGIQDGEIEEVPILLYGRKLYSTQYRCRRRIEK